MPLATIKNNDSIIFFNFRIDRPRQLSSFFILDDLSKANFGFDPYLVKYASKHEDGREDENLENIKRDPKLTNLYFVTMTEYSKILVREGALVAYPPESITIPLGRAISERGLTQLRMAESEKERFVTFYFNGQQEIVYQGESRIIIPSPKVATYDLKPEMSARLLTDELIKQISDPSNNYSFILLNFANADMVGHTGSIGAAVKACEVLDECLGKISNTTLALGGALLITADHGNAEQMINNQTGTIKTEHTTNPVPFIAISRNWLGKPVTLQSGILADVAPTILNLLKIDVPTSMTGRNLLKDVSY
jgi:2,3-bisphosphoglycerate-independent phosphoglycerate mutase